MFSESWDFEISWIKTKTVTLLKLITIGDNVASQSALSDRAVDVQAVSVCFSHQVMLLQPRTVMGDK